MPMDEVIVKINSISDAKGIVEMEHRLNNLNKAGQDTTQEMQALNVQSNKLGVNIKKANSVFRPFQMQLLSTMFLGMGVAATFGAMLQPSMNLVGIFDIFNNTLGVTFLPTALMVQDWAIKLMEVFLGLPTPVQEAMGTFVLLGFVLGKLLSTVSSIALGVAGLAYFFPSLIAAVTPFIAPILAIVAVVSVLVALWKNWENISVKMKIVIAAVGIALAALLVPFAPVVAAIVGIGVAMIGVIAIIKNWGAIIDWIKEKWTSVKGFFSNIFQGIGDFFQKYVVDPIKKGVDLVIAAVNKLIGIYNKISGAVGLPQISTIQPLGSRQSGGLIPQSGLYKLHAGESVAPASQNNMNFNPTINVYGASSNVDIINRIKAELNQQYAASLSRLHR